MGTRNYILDTEDGNNFFLGCGNTKPDKSDYIVIQGPLPHRHEVIELRRPGLRRAWQSAERKAQQAEIMRRNWEQGRITAHKTTDELRATRTRSTTDVWERRRKGKLAMPKHPDRSRPCTIDGIHVYPSVKALIDARGKGKQGRNHPDFRFIQL